jgi:hypothetical protein
MTDTQKLLDTFALLRSTWDDLVSLEPDIVSAGRPFTDDDLIELGNRVEAHRAALAAFAGAIAESRSSPNTAPDVWR